MQLDLEILLDIDEKPMLPAGTISRDREHSAQSSTQNTMATAPQSDQTPDTSNNQNIRKPVLIIL